MKHTNNFIFFRELPGRFAQIGAVMPSSRRLARTMVKPIAEAHNPVAILEVGPGTGPVTREILRRMGERDSLLVCEINRQLLNCLKRQLTTNHYYLSHKKQVKFFLGPVQALSEKHLEGKFDVIASSLPFSNFTAETVAEILALYRNLLKPNGTLTFFEYVGMRYINSLIKSHKERERLRAVDRVISKLRHEAMNSGALKTEITFLNVPPALTMSVCYPAQPV